MANLKMVARSRASNVRGFTLLELMIVVVIVAILAAIANAAYGFAVVKSRRASAKGCVMEASQYMERYYTTKLTYNDTITPAPPVLPGCSNDVTRYYTVGVAPTATTYVVTAVPIGAQLTADTKCGTLTIDQTGTRTDSGTGTVAECW